MASSSSSSTSSKKLILDDLLRGANSNVKEAYYQLALCYAEGRNGASQDNYLAIFYFKKAAELKHFEAQMELARNYGHGRFGIVKNVPEAIKQFEKAHAIALENKDQSQQASSLFSLSCCYFLLSPESLESGLPTLEKAAMLGNLKAQLYLGARYHATQEFSEALKWFRKASEQNYCPAQFALGRCYLLGEGVDKNPAMAALWILRAALETDERIIGEGRELIQPFPNFILLLESILKTASNEELFTKLAEEPLSEKQVKRLLILATQNNCLHLMKYLIDKRGADLKKRDENDETLLMLAVRNGCLGVFRFLLQVYQKNNELNDLLLIKNQKGHTVLDIANQLNELNYCAHRDECIRLIGLITAKELDNTTSRILSTLPARIIDDQKSMIEEKKKSQGFTHYQMSVLRRAASEGHASSQCQLGSIYLQNQKIREAAIWLEKSSAQGNSEAQKYLDEIYQIEPNTFLREDLMYIAAIFCRNIAECIRKEMQNSSLPSSSSIRFNRFKALEALLSRLSKEGLNFIFVEEYFRQLDVPEELADLYLQTAIDCEFYHLVTLLLRVYPATSEVSETTLNKLEKKSGKGSSEANFCLSIFYEIFDFDIEKAAAFRKRAEVDYLEAKKYAVIHNFTAPEEKWLKKASDEGDLLSKTLLGQCYENSGHIYQAMLCYTEAAKHGERQAQIILCKKVNEIGVGHALFWGLKAASQGSLEALFLLGGLVKVPETSSLHYLELIKTFSRIIKTLNIPREEIIYLYQRSMKLGYFSLASRFNEYLILNPSSQHAVLSMSLMEHVDLLIPENKDITLTANGDPLYDPCHEMNHEAKIVLNLDDLVASQRPSSGRVPLVSQMVWEWAILNAPYSGGYPRFYLNENIKIAQSCYRYTLFSSLFDSVHKTLSSRFYVPVGINKIITSYVVEEPTPEETASQFKCRI